MSTTVKYKGNTLTTVSNATKTLKTAGKYMEGDVVLVDVTESGSGSGVVWQDGQGYIHLSDEGDIELQTKTVTPTETAQTITPDAGYYALDRVNVGAISSSYVGSGVTRQSSSDLTASGATVTAPAGYYASSASKSVATGTAGTPTATKGTVSNHAVSVTPSVTNTTGYITGSTKTGTAVAVSASELVSGTKSITENGTGIDVTNYASVDVDVPTGGSSYTHIGYATYTVSTTSTTAISVGTFETGDTSIWTSAKMVFIKIRDLNGRRNGYFYGSDSIVCNNALGNGLTATSSYMIYGTMYYQNSIGNLVNINLQRTSTSTAVAGYGVYPHRIYDDGSITIQARYSTSTSYPTQTIDGTFKVDVYLLEWPDDINPFVG